MKAITKSFYPALALFAVAFTFLPRVQAEDGGRGNGNTAEGWEALGHLTTGFYNTAMGTFALENLTSGNYNTAIGFQALTPTNGSDNVAIGALALSHNISSQNVAIGTAALGSNRIGGGNTAVGENALRSNTSGGNNVAVGNGALYFGNGNQNIALGFLAGSNTGNGGGNIYIGAQMLGNASDINHTYIANISSTNVSGAGTDTVTVDLTTGLIGHLTSSRRYKEEIKPMENASETIYRLHPVTYRYKKAIDPTQSAAFGLIAEDVAEINPNLVARDAKGQPETVHYEMVNAMLLNEFLKEHRTVEEQECTIREQDATIAEVKSNAARQGATVARLQKQIDALTAGLQKLSAQLEVSKAAPQTALNNQ
jgi:uncharacterized coiled-coil protein SlyX